MRRTRWWTIVVASLLAVPNIAAAQRIAGRATMPSPQMLDQYGLEQPWWNQATLDPSRSTALYLTADEENVYLQSSFGTITGFDGETGRKLWAVQLGRRDSPTYAAVSNEDVVLVASALELYALDKFTGKVRWEVSLPKMPSTSPAVDMSKIYVGTLDGSVFAFGLDKIHHLYTNSLLPQYSGLTHTMPHGWRYKTARRVTTQPVASPTGLTVNFASDDKSLYSVSSDDRRLLWQFETDAPVSAPLASVGRRLFLATEDVGGNFYCIDSENGRMIWSFPPERPIRRAPFVVENQLLIFPEQVGLLCLTADTGRLLWRRNFIVQFLGATKRLLFTSDSLGNVVILNRSDGAVLGSMPLRHFPVRFGNDRTNRLYLATTRGLIVALREKGTQLPTFFKFPERLPIPPESILPEFAPPEPAVKEPATKPPAKETKTPATQPPVKESKTPATEPPAKETKTPATEPPAKETKTPATKPPAKKTKTPATKPPAKKTKTPATKTNNG